MRNVTYTTVKEYFKSLSTNHKDINSFVGYAAEELASEMAKLRGLSTPVLVLFNYEGKLDGNKQRTLANRTISFAILKSVTKKDDFTEQYSVIAECEVLGLSVMSRINYDSKYVKDHWLHNNFMQETVRFNEVKYRGKEALFGMEFFFDIKTSEPLTININNWVDLSEGE